MIIFGMREMRWRWGDKKIEACLSCGGASVIIVIVIVIVVVVGGGDDIKGGGSVEEM